MPSEGELSTNVSLDTVVAVGLLYIMSRISSSYMLDAIGIKEELNDSINSAVNKGLIVKFDSKYEISKLGYEIINTISPDITKLAFERIHEIYLKALNRGLIAPETYIKAICEIADLLSSKDLSNEAVLHISRALDSVKKYDINCDLVYNCVNKKVMLLVSANRFSEARNALRSTLTNYSVCYDRINADAIMARIKLGILNELLGNEYTALFDYEDALSMAFRLNDVKTLSYSMYTYYRLRALMCNECNDYENLLRPAEGWDLEKLLKHSELLDKEIVVRISRLLAILLIGVGHYGDAYKLIINDDSEDAELLREMIDVLRGNRNCVGTKWKGSVISGLADMINSINKVNCPLVNCKFKNMELFLNNICSVIEENKNKMLSCIIPKIILLNDELHKLLFIK